MWMMGVSMAISLSSQRKQGTSRGKMTSKVILRALKLFLLGMFLNGGSDLGNWRVLGVLQYFSVSFLINALADIWLPVLDLTLSCSRPPPADVSSRYRAPPRPFGEGEYSSLVGGREDDEQPVQAEEDGWAHALRDCWPHRLHFLLMSVLLLIYLCLEFYLPVPGCPTGYLGPGGLAMPPGQEHCTGGAHRLIDLKIFGEHHICHGLTWPNVPTSAATCQDTYDCDVYDPEGTLGMLTAAVMTFLGLQAGRIIVHYKSVSPWAMVKRWLAWGLVLCAIATGLCGASKNDGVMPLNKNLWSPSFIACMAGTGFLALTLTYVLVDYWKVWTGAPFRFVGMNSIIVYAGSEILQGFFPFSFQDHSSGDKFSGGFMTHAGALASNCVAIACWCTVAYLMFRNKFFYNL